MSQLRANAVKSKSRSINNTASTTITVHTSPASICCEQEQQLETSNFINMKTIRHKY